MCEGTLCACWIWQECCTCSLILMHTRARVAGLQVDTLHLTVERIGSACRGPRSSVYANLESLAVTHVACEDDVQVQAAPCTVGLTGPRTVCHGGFLYGASVGARVRTQEARGLPVPRAGTGTERARSHTWFTPARHSAAHRCMLAWSGGSPAVWRLCSQTNLALLVQDVLAVVGVAHAPRLRHLQIQAAPAPPGSNARPVVVGCRGPHPDLRQLARLAVDPSITLCINLLRYLSSLPGLSLSEGLQRAVDAYLSRRCVPCPAARAARSAYAQVRMPARCTSEGRQSCQDAAH